MIRAKNIKEASVIAKPVYMARLTSAVKPECRAAIPNAAMPAASMVAEASIKNRIRRLILLLIVICG
jgi:hypothetical protein